MLLSVKSKKHLIYFIVSISLAVVQRSQASQEDGIFELPLIRHLQEENEQYSSKATLAHDVRNHGNYAYSTQLYLGSHHQPVSLLLDTGSSIMWVQS